MDDLIRRQDAIDAITASINQFGSRYTTEQLNMWGLFTQMIRELPSAQPEAQKYGHWIKIRDEEDGNTLYECSECHKGECHCHIVEVSYCWNCGARMDGDAVDS